MTDLGQLYDVLRGADVVIHLAAVPCAGVLPPAPTLMQNVSGAYNLLLAAHRLGIRRMVVASSIQAIHRVGHPIRARFHYFPLDGAHPLDPKDEYGLSKLMVEQAAEMFARYCGMTIVSLRYVWVCTPDEWCSPPHPPPEADAIDPLPFCLHIEDAAHAAWLAATADLPQATHIPAFISCAGYSFHHSHNSVSAPVLPYVPVRGELSDYTAPISLTLARQAFGFAPRYACHASTRG